MSLIPMIFSHWWEDLDSPHHLYDQHFGLPYSTDDLLDRTYMIRNPRRYLQQRHHPYDKSLRLSQQGTGVSTVQSKKDKFQVNLDVQQFAPNEINVKVVGRCVVVEGKHEEKQDEHGWICRHFIRKYPVPEQCDAEQLQSQLSSDGVLTITAPRKEQVKPDERLVRIQQTGQPAIREGVSQTSQNPREQYMHSPQKGQMQQQRGMDKIIKAA